MKRVVAVAAVLGALSAACSSSTNIPLTRAAGADSVAKSDGIVPGARFANVQSHSGANANLAAFMALMQPGDHFLGINLSSAMKVQTEAQR